MSKQRLKTPPVRSPSPPAAAPPEMSSADTGKDIIAYHFLRLALAAQDRASEVAEPREPLVKNPPSRLTRFEQLPEAEPPHDIGGAGPVSPFSEDEVSLLQQLARATAVRIAEAETHPVSAEQRASQAIELMYAEFSRRWLEQYLKDHPQIGLTATPPQEQSRSVPDPGKDKPTPSSSDGSSAAVSAIQGAIRIALLGQLAKQENTTREVIGALVQKIHEPIIQTLEEHAKAAPKAEADEVRGIISGLKQADRALAPTKGIPRTQSHDPISQIQGFTTAIKDEAHGKTPQLQAFFNSIEGHEFKTIEEKRVFAAELRRLFNAIDQHCECPTCGEPAKLRVTAGRYRQGTFQFDHKGTSSHGGSTRVPAIKLVDPPPNSRFTR